MPFKAVAGRAQCGTKRRLLLREDHATENHADLLLLSSKPQSIAAALAEEPKFPREVVVRLHNGRCGLTPSGIAPTLLRLELAELVQQPARSRGWISC